MNRALAVLMLLVSLGALAAPRRRSVRVPDGWTTPQCTSVAGFPTVALSLDGGRTTLPIDEPLEDVQIYTFGLAATNTPNRLLAVTAAFLLVSDDAGCTWRSEGFRFPERDYRLVRTRGAVWAWSILSPQLFLFDDRPGVAPGAAAQYAAPADLATGAEPRQDTPVVVSTSAAERQYRPPVVPATSAANARQHTAPVIVATSADARQFAAPVALPIAFFVDGDDPRKLAVADDQGAIFWSDDGAVTWQASGRSPARAPVYSTSFAPNNRLHVVTGGTADGAHVTFDGGATWTRAKGLDGDNVFRLEFSSVDPKVIWAVVLDPQSTSKYRRAIYRSDDGGLTFREVMRESEEIDFPNGFTIAASPRNASLLWFALPGTTLYLIDDEGTIRQQTTLPHRDINTILVSPASPNVLYFGLKVSDMSGT